MTGCGARGQQTSTMIRANSFFLRYLSVTSAIGLTLGATHGMISTKKNLSEAFPTILTHAVGGVIFAQYFPVTVPYYLNKKSDCPRRLT